MQQRLREKGTSGSLFLNRIKRIPWNSTAPVVAPSRTGQWTDMAADTTSGAH
ncbi:MAG: hypothetical protein ACLR23_29080 [Clostridia bacterium]